jgi:CubicO group peptidase (beta-lactamase class C family)
MALRLLLGLLVLTLQAGASAAQAPLAPSKPENAGMSAAVLRDAVGLFEKAVADDELRGAVVLVARRGQIAVHEAVGWRDKEKRLPMQKDTLFHVASNTKPVVAAAVLMLVQEGKLDLDAEVRRYLPSFDNGKSKAITVRQLLNHTSGFRIPVIFLKPLIEKSADHPEAPSLRIEVDRFGTLGPKETPGRTFSYSNPGYNTLGALVEATSKQSLETFLTARIYRPLGMTDAMHQDRKDSLERRACIYRKTEGKWKVTYRPGDPPMYPFVRASGGLITTAEDYAKFLQLFLNGGRYNGERLLQSETVRLATTPQTRSVYSAEEQKRRTTYYGFGWHVSTDGRYWHGGSDGTYAWVDPKNEIVGVIFTQSPGGRIPQTEFMRLVSQASNSKKP